MRARRQRRSRPAARPPRRGRLDRRLIRRARLACLRLSACRARPGYRSIECSRLGDSRPGFPAPALSEGARRGVSGRVFNSPEPVRTIGRVFDTAEGTPLQAGRVTVRRAGRPRAASRAPRPLGTRGETWAPSGGCEVEASCYVMRPSYHAGAAASFANRTAMQIVVSRQCGGVGSGGKPDKAGADFEERQAVVVDLRVQVRRTPLVPMIGVVRGLSDGELFDSPELGVRLMTTVRSPL